MENAQLSVQDDGPGRDLPPSISLSALTHLHLKEYDRVGGIYSGLPSAYPQFFFDLRRQYPQLRSVVQVFQTSILNLFNEVLPEGPLWQDASWMLLAAEAGIP